MKRFVGPEELRDLSFGLGKTIGLELQKTNQRKVFLVGLWRGGGFITICVDEILSRFGIETDCVAVRTSRYIGVDQATEEVKVHSLGYLKNTIQPDDVVILIDDVWDSGKSIMKVKEIISSFGAKVLIGVIFFKPTRNKFPTERPDFFVEESNEWLNFPHELEGLSESEIESHFGDYVHSLLFHPKAKKGTQAQTDTKIPFHNLIYTVKGDPTGHVMAALMGVAFGYGLCYSLSYLLRQ